MDDNKPVKTGNNRNNKGQFEKGISGNPKGRPPGTAYIKLLEEAIHEVEKEVKKSFFKKVIEKAYTNPAVMISVLKKFIPDKTHAENETEFIDKTVDKAEQELERKFVEKLEQDPEYKKRVFELYKETESILKEGSS